MGLTKVAITRPVFILMLMVAAVLMGWLSYTSMRVELQPDVQFGVVTVTSVYPGAGPDEIQNLVSRPIEEAVSSVANLQEVTSSSQEGVSTVVLQFAVGTNMDAALNEVRSKVDTVVGRLPREVEKPVIDKIDTASDPVMTIALKSSSLSNRQIRDLADNKLKDLFARIPGVATVIVSGGEVREIQVRLRRDALLTYRIGINDVQRAVQASALNVPSGRVVTPDEEYAVRVLGEFRSVEEIGNVWINVRDQEQPGPGKIVRLADIATIVDANAERRSYSRLNGAESVTLVIQKAKEGSAVSIADAIQKEPFQGSPSLLAHLKEAYGLESVVTNDTSIQIRESLFDLNFALGFGILLVMLTVWLFLHNFRGTLIVAIAIPVCLFATFIALKAAGQTINNLSMLALSLAIGVLVDDAIVVIENIYRHLTMGEDPVEAAINGRSEIGLAAIAITLADVVVFVPIAFMGGVVGQFFKPLAIGYAVAVMLSLFVSFTVTPMLASRWYRKGEDWEHPKGGFARWFEGWFQNLSLRYRRLLEWSLRHRWYTFGIGWAFLFGLFMFIGGSFAPTAVAAAMTGMPLAMVAVALTVLIAAGNGIRKTLRPVVLLHGVLFALVFPAFGLLGYGYRAWKGEDVFKGGFFPPSDSGQVQVLIDLPPGANLAATERVVERVEDVVLAHPEAKYVTSSIGTRGGGFAASDQGTNYASIRVTLHEKQAILDLITFWKKHEEKLRTVSNTQVAAELLEEIGRVPGAKIRVSSGDNFGFGSAIQMSFRSDDRAKLLETTSKIRDGLAEGEVKGVVSPEISSKPGKPEFRALPDRARLADAGLTVADVGGAMRVLYAGDDQAKFRVLGQEYDVRVMMDTVDRDNPDLVRQVPVSFQQGEPVFLNDVATIVDAQGVDKIDRRDRQEEIQVSADLLPGFAAGNVQAQIDAWMKEQNLIPEDVQYRPLGQADVQARETGYLLSALALGLVLVFMVLASLYNNLLYPFIIQLAQPQAMIGALLALIITDKTLNIVGFIGIIAMVGLVGKNAILLVDYTNTLRERGMDRFEALCESGQTRLRPILMTTLALLAGLMPVALAIGRGSEFRETIGITIIGGTLLSTLLTLLVIPCSYSIFDDLSKALTWRKKAAPQSE
jgi:hydrophobic/amphiphilic exporter-1 (mainly G- bacteria), HAE1 family